MPNLPDQFGFAQITETVLSCLELSDKLLSVGVERRRECSVEFRWLGHLNVGGFKQESEGTDLLPGRETLRFRSYGSERNAGEDSLGNFDRYSCYRRS